MMTLIGIGRTNVIEQVIMTAGQLTDLLHRLLQRFPAQPR